MTAIRHSTSDVPSHQSFEYWPDWVCGTFVNLDCKSAMRKTFTGTLVAQPFSSLLLTTMTSDKMELLRSPKCIATGREDCFLIALEGQTSSALVQDGREGHLQVGDFSIVDSRRPYSVLFDEGFRHHVLRIPRSEITRRVGNIDPITGTAIDGSKGAGKLASMLCRALSSEADTLSPGTVDQVSNTLLDLFAVALGERLTNSNVSETSVRNAWFAQISKLHRDESSRPRTLADENCQLLRYFCSIFVGTLQRERHVDRTLSVRTAAV